jgi:hypothetical protein
VESESHLAQLNLRILMLLTTIVLTFHVIVYFSFAVSLIPFPFDYDQAEGFELNNSILLAQGKCPYCDNDTYPYFASGYPPVFHYLMVPFVWLFGPALWYGRLMIFLSTLATAATIAYIVWRHSKLLLLSIIAGFAFLASNYIYHIGPLLRQHLLMVMFETLAVVIAGEFLFASKQSRTKVILVLVLVLILAGYTKQLAYTTCLAVLIWLLLRNPRSSISTGALLAVGAGAIFGLAWLTTDGSWWLNIIVSNQNEYIPEQFYGLLRQFVSLHWPLLLLAIAVVLYEIYFERISVYAVWFVVSFISTIGSGKWGAGDSYYATTLASACVLSGLFLSRAVANSWQAPQIIRRQPQLIRFAAVSLMLVYSLIVFKMPTSGPIYGTIADIFSIQPKPGHRYPFYDSADWTVGYAVTGHFPSEQDYRNGEQILERVRNTVGDVISEDATFAILAGREVVTNPIQLKNLWDNDRSDPTNLIRQIQNQEFGLIIRRGNFFPAPVLAEIDTYYHVDTSIEMNGFVYELWTPKS